MEKSNVFTRCQWFLRFALLNFVFPEQAYFTFDTVAASNPTGNNHVLSFTVTVEPLFLVEAIPASRDCAVAYIWLVPMI